MRQDGRGYAVSGERAQCKRCGNKSVFWRQTASGKWVLMQGRGLTPYDRICKNGKWVDILASHGGDFHKCNDPRNVEIP